MSDANFNRSSLLLRPESQPIQWAQLTEQQRDCVTGVIKMLAAAAESLSKKKDETNYPDWLELERHSQLAFIDGRRGTGKTSVMTTIVRLLCDKDFAAVNDTGLKCELEQLSGRVVPLEPLDMEPLPNETHLVAAILARIYRAISDKYDRRSNCSAGCIEDSPEYIRFEQLVAELNRSLVTNLDARKGSLDREQYGQAVTELEDDRLRIRQRLEEVLENLPGRCEEDTRRKSSNKQKDGRLFLVIIDDVDLNPERCLELLRTLRAYSPPQLFFLLMGQYELVETIINMQIAAEYQKVRGSNNDFTIYSSKLIQNRIADVSHGAIRKIIPKSFTLSVLSPEEALDFCPNRNDQPQHQKFSELLTQIQLPTSQLEIASLPGSYDNVYKLLRSKTDLFELHPIINAFSITPRHLLDLYTSLEQALKAPSGQKRNKRLLGVFLNHWQRAIREDPLVSATLERSSLTTQELVNRPFDFLEFRVEQEIDDNHYDILVEKPNFESSSNTTLEPPKPSVHVRVHSPAQNLRYFGLGLKERFQSEDAASRRIQCSDHTFGCFVLFHELSVAFSNTESDLPLDTLSNIPSLLSTVWSNEQHEAIIPWPKPDFISLTTTMAFLSSVARSGSDFKASSRKEEVKRIQELVYRYWEISVDLISKKPGRKKLAPEALRRLFNVEALFFLPEICGDEGAPLFWRDFIRPQDYSIEIGSEVTLLQKRKFLDLRAPFIKTLLDNGFKNLVDRLKVHAREVLDIPFAIPAGTRNETDSIEERFSSLSNQLSLVQGRLNEAQRSNQISSVEQLLTQATIFEKMNTLASAELTSLADQSASGLMRSYPADPNVHSLAIRVCIRRSAAYRTLQQTDIAITCITKSKYLLERSKGIGISDDERFLLETLVLYESIEVYSQARDFREANTENTLLIEMIEKRVIEKTSMDANYVKLIEANLRQIRLLEEYEEAASRLMVITEFANRIAEFSSSDPWSCKIASELVLVLGADIKQRLSDSGRDAVREFKSAWIKLVKQFQNHFAENHLLHYPIAHFLGLQYYFEKLPDELGNATECAVTRWDLAKWQAETQPSEPSVTEELSSAAKELARLYELQNKSWEEAETLVDAIGQLGRRIKQAENKTRIFELLLPLFETLYSIKDEKVRELLKARNTVHWDLISDAETVLPNSPAWRELKAKLGSLWNGTSGPTNNEGNSSAE